MSASLLDLFLELCAIPSPPGHERLVADRVEEYLDGLGVAWHEDDTGPVTHSTMGNIHCQLPGRLPGGVPIFFCAHLDTVPLEDDVRPVIADGVVRNECGTILGADNKSAVAVMLESARRIVEGGRPHAGIELVFTSQEEVGLIGVSAFDHSRLEATLGFVYDHAAPIGLIVDRAPSVRKLEARFHGRAAHAGMAPEDGRSAIVAAARAIAELPLGRLDETTTASIGTIVGGTARNIVPEWCTIEGEIRAQDPQRLVQVTQEIVDAISYAASVSDCTVETVVRSLYDGYSHRHRDPALELAAEGLRSAGVEPQYGASGGGADANVFVARGRTCVNLANGMAEIHTSDEHIAVDDLELMVDVTLGIVDAARVAS